MATKTEKKFKREVLLRDPRFSCYQKDFLGVILKNPEYTIKEAQEAVEAFFGRKEAQ